MKEKEKLKILTDLIKIHSVNGNEFEVAKYIAALFQKKNISVRIDRFDSNRANLIAEIGEKRDKGVLCFTGHQDTVAVGQKDGWNYEPFSGKVVAGKIYGRGAADMKSGLAAQIITLLELVEEQHIPAGMVRFVATAGEEYGAQGAYRLNDQGMMNDVAALVVGEPTSGQVIYAHSGSLNYQIKSYGKAVHSSRPGQGVNAISGLMQYINAEQTLFDDVPLDPLLGNVQHSITVIKGGQQVNSIPSYAEIYGNIRPTKKFNNNQVIERIQKKIKEINRKSSFKLVFSIVHNFYPVGTLPQNWFVQLVQKITDDEYPDREINLRTINGATDASVFIQSKPEIPVVILGADAWKEAHQLNEYTTVTSYLTTIQIYKKIALNFFKQGRPVSVV
ncbi:ArgE/DapE family deacylase [Liquorilactobacillus capillatus]|uniref:Probable succinyl-diaminopimelate desuccinylase n=1 Tax=Liquorilactobacillus capillatus DSM 19910 TaxID=1423731 RepID=A0A0R1LYW1_9LACO|nr:ArgE/DapE family deacylase [Liquorilactobacillus capillatus]KRL00854.1 peptidase, ArgE DapE family [Liquorilactobacillus capillatus DSM 19910]